MKTWQIILLVAAILVLVVCGGGGAIVMLGVQGKGPMGAMMSDPFLLLVEHPDTVAVGEEFDIEIEVINAGDKDLEITTMDLETPFLDGFEIVSVDPNPQAFADSGFGFATWTLEPPLTISTAENKNITIRLRASTAGVFQGELDVCTPAEAFSTYNLEVTVE